MINKIKKMLNPNNEFRKEKIDYEKEYLNLKNNSSLEIIKKFKSRRSIRKFSNDKIDWKIINDILEGAINAPCAGNVQNYKIIVIEDENTRKELGKIACQQFWLSSAPTIIVIVRDNYDLIKLYPKDGEKYSIQNVSALIENILMLTHLNNLGACWVEAFNESVLKEFLKIPMECNVDAIIPIGYCLENPKIDKEDLFSKLFFESFGNRKK